MHRKRRKRTPAALRFIPAELPEQVREDWRRLPFVGADNYRDLGGYPTHDGRRVKWGLIYRSGHLGSLTNEDMAFLTRLNLKKVVDFRGPEERKRKPDRLPEGIKSDHHPIDVAGSDLEKRIFSAIRGKAELNAAAYISGVNRLFATQYTPVYREWIQDIIQNPDALPQAFHCTAGKDRAGFASAMLLSLLGVPRQIVVADYLKTNDYTSEKVDRIIRKVRLRSIFRSDGEIIRPLLQVDERHIHIAFDAVDVEWGSFESYRTDGLGLSDEDLAALQDRLLELPSDP